MCKLKVSKIWIPALLLAVLVVGCSDPDKNAGAGGPGSPLTPPTVTGVTPPNGSLGACLNSASITATFSKPMNPSTINTSTFTLAGPGAASVPGTVSLDSTGEIATFTPTSALTGGAAYVATITTGAKDTFGNALAAKMTWTFTTGSLACPGPVALGAACGTGILGGSAVTSTGLSIVNGDVDVSPGSAISGFPPGIINGIRHTTDATDANAQAALTTAFTTASTLPPGTSLQPNIGGLPAAFPPGVYTTIAQPSLGITGNLTLDGVGNPNAVWIFQISSTLTTASGSVILINGAQAKNVYWAIGSAATLGTGTTMAGNMMAMSAITLNTGVTLNGRALARTAGAVSIDASTINVPASCQ